MSEGVILACVGLGTAALVVLVAQFLLAPGRRIARRVRNASLSSGANPEHAPSLFRDHRATHTQGRFFNRLAILIEQSGVEISVRQVLISGISLAVLAICIGILATGWVVPSGIAGALLPVVVLLVLRQRRISRLRSQLPEALDVMRRAMQAGQSMDSAISQVAHQCQAPLADEFRQTYEQQNLGLSFDAALRDLTVRIPVIEMQMLVMALTFHRQSGGSPVETLKNSADLLRKRQRLARRIRSLTAEGRMQAVVLALLPILAFASLTWLRPSYIRPLAEHTQVLAGLVAMQVLGTLWIRKIVRLEY